MEEAFADEVKPCVIASFENTEKEEERKLESRNDKHGGHDDLPFVILPTAAQGEDSESNEVDRPREVSDFVKLQRVGNEETA